MTASHTAKNLLFSCIDDRLSAADDQFIAALPGGAFHAGLAGGGAALVSPEDHTTAIKQILAAYQINHITDVYLESHTDCGAYRLAGVTFANPEEELVRLRTDLEQAADAIRTALIAAGPGNTISIHPRVVDPSGRVLT